MLLGAIRTPKPEFVYPACLTAIPVKVAGLAFLATVQPISENCTTKLTQLSDAGPLVDTSKSTKPSAPSVHRDARLA